MEILDRYNAALDARAAEYRQAAAQAKARGDEREQSIALMQESMLGDMLKVLGRTELTARPGILQAQIERLEQRAKAAHSREDYDAADRLQRQAQTIRWAKDLLAGLEAEA